MEVVVVVSVFDNIEELANLLSAEDDNVAAQGWEILNCLDASVRWQLASHLLTPHVSAWRLATGCLLPEPMARMRLARFRVRCVQLRLLRLREQGIEAPAWAWRLTDMAEQYATGRLSEADYQRLLRETEYLRAPWREVFHDEIEFGDGEIDLEMIPSDWPARFDALGEQLDIAPMLRVPETHRLSATWATLDRLEAVEEAAAFLLVERTINAFGEETQVSIPAPETVEEWGLQRRLWESIMLHSEDGIDVLYGRTPDHSDAPVDEQCSEGHDDQDWGTLSWG